MLYEGGSVPKSEGQVLPFTGLNALLLTIAVV